MTRLLLIFVFLSFSVSSFAQERTGWQIQGSAELLQDDIYRSEGDTLLYIDGVKLKNVAIADTADFILVNSDIDQLIPSNVGFAEEFAFGLWSTDNHLFLPGDYDTAWFMGATSWFTPPGKADNWLVMGPITIPAGGADLSWYHRHNRGWSDSYRLFVTEAGPQPYSQIDPDSIVPFFTKQQITYPAPQAAQDTLWTWETIQLHSYSGKRVFIAFMHDAFDGDMLFLDDILVIERNNIGFEEEVELDINVFPNPSSGTFHIQSRNFSGEATLSLSDLTGKQLRNAEIVFIANTYQLDISEIPSGIYLLNIQNDQQGVSKLIVKQ